VLPLGLESRIPSMFKNYKVYGYVTSIYNLKGEKLHRHIDEEMGRQRAPRGFLKLP
jgi:hypothetical protein